MVHTYGKTQHCIITRASILHRSSQRNRTRIIAKSGEYDVKEKLINAENTAENKNKIGCGNHQLVKKKQR